MSAPRRIAPAAPARRGWCPGLARPMPTGDGLLARIHPPGGVLSPAQARAVADAARRFGNGHVDVTARANLQVRGVRDETRGPLAAALEAAGLGDARRDGGPQRLTLTHPLAGLDPDEGFDVAGLARAIEARGLAISGLPAKTLVTVEGPRRRLGETGADLLIRATGPGAAALGLAAEDGTLWLGPVAEPCLSEAAAAALAAFAATGGRRMRDLSEAERAEVARRAGPPNVPAPARERFAREADRVRGQVSPERSPHEADLARTGEALRDAGLPAGLIPLANGRVALVAQAPFGRCGADALDRLAAIADGLGTAEIRLAPTRGFVLLAPGRAAAEAALGALRAQRFVTEPDDPRRAVAACPGAPACASGSTPTLLDAARLAEAFRPFAARGLTAHVSGCPKGCAHPGAAALTLVGLQGRYGVVLGGTPGDEPAMQLTFEAALERVRRADSALGLDHAFRT
ncbi:precorrin-3B synthase [Methylobacterium soli]|uniref:Precorrin-3B synthase n=1 Tax=Methylobacterium soli TaxID=553447 RepID=A0A6L3SZK3_9HYPH|nr:precorrin-3B synthase [Methylobacterium soli]KAB1079613.1 precorrin-3B synthase [Methylobacterium soli]